MDRAKVVTAFLLRVVAGFLFIHAGGMKLFGWFGGMPGGATASFPSQIWFGGVLEAFGGLLILLGLCTRPVAFVLAGELTHINTVGGGIAGVASTFTGPSIKSYNTRTKFNEWEFVFQVQQQGVPGQTGQPTNAPTPQNQNGGGTAPPVNATPPAQ